MAAVGRFIREVGLPAWFAAMTAVHLGTTSTTREAIGLDARIYYRGADAWIHSRDPWAAFAQMANGHYHFAGLPSTVEVFAPFAFIPEDLFVLVAMLVSLGASVYILWKLKLPGSWLLFPPIAQALISANPQLVVLALLVAGWPLLSGLAVLLKVYAVVPLLIEGRWKAVVSGAALLFGSVAVASGLWFDYISRFGTITARLNAEAAGGFSAWGLPLSSVFLVIGALVILVVLDRRSAAWLAVPALWPATQLHYSALALPVITPLMAFVLAIPQHGIPVAVLLVLAAWRLLVHVGARNERLARFWRLATTPKRVDFLRSRRLN